MYIYVFLPGLLGDSDSDLSDLDNSLLQPTTPLNDLSAKKDAHHVTSKGFGMELEQDDFDFYG